MGLDAAKHADATNTKGVVGRTGKTSPSPPSPTNMQPIVINTIFSSPFKYHSCCISSHVDFHDFSVFHGLISSINTEVTSYGIINNRVRRMMFFIYICIKVGYETFISAVMGLLNTFRIVKSYSVTSCSPVLTMYFSGLSCCAEDILQSLPGSFYKRFRTSGIPLEGV